MIQKRYVQIVVACLILGGAITVNAQQKQTYKVNLTEQIKQLCGLTPEQINKVGPIIRSFEKRRDSLYSMYHTNASVLKMEVHQNKWQYETSLIGLITPSQMGLVKVFDQNNPDLMTYNSSHVISVNYMADAK